MPKSRAIIFSLCVAGISAAILWFTPVSEQRAIEQTQLAVRQSEPAEEKVKEEPWREELENLIDIKKKLPQKHEEVSLIAVGDIMLSRDVDTKMRRYGYGYPWEKVRGYLASGDIIFGNLETAITPGRKIGSYEMSFRADPENAAVMADVGFDILSLANNHSMNFGESGMKDTMNYLDAAGIIHCGAGEEDLAYAPMYLVAKGIRFAFLAYESPSFVPNSYAAGSDRVGVAFMDKAKMTAAVQQAKQNADLVIVSMHDGVEYTDSPNRNQIDFAHAAIDAGADMVIGHHPHVTQGVELYRDKYIFYSLGNFVFDQMWSRETRRGLILKAYFNKEGATKIELVPVLIEDYAQPQIIENKEKYEVLARLRAPLVERESFFYDEETGMVKNISYSLLGKEAPSSFNVLRVKVEDLDADGNFEKYILQNGVLEIREAGKTIFESSPDWWIDDFSLADATGDGIINVNMSVWRAGNYGSDMPFWEEENDMSVKNHFLVYKFSEKILKPLWHSSSLDNPNCDFLFHDVDADGREELLVIEGEYGDDWLCQGKYLALWEWNEWGFYNKWRSEAGEYNRLSIETIGTKDFIFAD